MTSNGGLRQCLRRGILAALGGMALAPRAARAGLPIPGPGMLAFKALRNGSELGSHTVRFTGSADALTVTSVVEYVVYLGPIAVFRYRLHGVETWQGDSLIGYVADVDDDGSRSRVTVTRQADAMMVAGGKGAAYAAPAGTLVSSHWNMGELGGPMINAGTGELLRFAIARDGPDPVRDAAGAMIPADRFSLTGPDTIDLWYDGNKTWAGLRAVAKDRSVVTYERR